MHGRLFRVLVFLLASWPVLLPPGVCICGLVRGNTASGHSPRCQCAVEHDESCSFSKDQHEAVCSVACCGCQDGSTECPCPLVCPANRSVDHSWLSESQPPVMSPEAVASLAFCCDLTAGIRLGDHDSPAPTFDRPIYLALCTLLI